MSAPDVRIRVKLLGNFASPTELCRQWGHMSKGDLRWNGIEVTDRDDDIDFYAIINAPGPGDFYIPERSIVFQIEPWCPEPWQTWGVKTWGDWASPDPARFLQVRSHRTHLNNAFWQLRASYDELRTRPVVKTRTLSAICGAKYFDPGHIKRIDFLRFLERKDDDVVRVDLYARENPLGFAHWHVQQDDERDVALAPYRYFFAAENNREHNFITEKLFEPLLTETLCFYWGCPNAADWLDPRAYIVLDLDDFEGAFRTMKSAILANEWEKRLDAIRCEKQKVLEHYQLFPTLERVLQHELRLPARADDLTVRYHKYFAKVLGETIDSVCFIHSYTRNGNTTVLAEILARLEDSGLLDRLAHVYVVNCGDEIDPALVSSDVLRGGRVEIIEYSPDTRRAEAPTLDLVKAFATFHPGAKVLYLHTKGASHSQQWPSIDDWRRLMLHFLVGKHADAWAGLAENDVVGCNLQEQPHPHFSGNFWWANARYLRDLPPVPTTDRHAAEWWVLGGEEVTAASLHDSGVDHYRESYPADRYMDSKDLSSVEISQDAAPPAPARHDQASICLVMIVRNEAHIVTEALASMRPWVRECVVIDTGSSDGTQDTIRRYCEANGMKVRVFDRAWRNFGANRTEALALAREHSHADYLWMFDADDVLHGVPDVSALQADAYHVHFGPDTGYRRVQVFRRTLPWRYVGVVHEYPACDVPDVKLGDIAGAYHVESRRMGDRSRDPLKYARDAAILQSALAEEPGNARYMFYLGQSWYDAGEFAKALDAYARRATMGGWSEEVFYARYRAAICREALEHPCEDVLAAYEACALDYPHRAEPSVRAAAFARRHQRFRDAYVFARRAGQVLLPDASALFVDTADYQWRAADEQAIAAYYCGFLIESFELCSALLEGRTLPDAERTRIEQNRDYAAPAMLASLSRHDAQRVDVLAKRTPLPNPELTLTITSCRRLDLFLATVSSFLQACSDVERIGRFICIDDNSSDADRAMMRETFPFFEFIFKGPADRGHARSLNTLRDTVRSPWWLHLEDDWQFLSRRPYVAQAIEMLEEDPGLGQVLFNRNYAETLEDRDIVGGTVRRTSKSGVRVRIHEHVATDSPDYAHYMAALNGRSNAWWPHYSLRPSLLRTSAVQRVGAFDEAAAHFELDYAKRYMQAGYRSAFFDGVHALHTGKLTSERGPSARANAYALNGMPQFGESSLASSQPDADQSDAPDGVLPLARSAKTR